MKEKPAKKKREKKELALDSISWRKGIVAGVAVRVCFDGNGKPLGAHYAGIEPLGDREHEGQVAVAVAHAVECAAAEARRVQKKEAAALSAKKRAAQKHPTNKWFVRAHREHPEFGRDKLVQEARRLAAQAGITLKKRNDITEQRARQFLERKQAKKKAGS